MRCVSASAGGAGRPACGPAELPGVCGGVCKACRGCGEVAWRSGLGVAGVRGLRLHGCAFDGC
jgi:hypothetical protein